MQGLAAPEGAGDFPSFSEDLPTSRRKAPSVADVVRVCALHCGCRTSQFRFTTPAKWRSEGRYLRAYAHRPGAKGHRVVVELTSKRSIG